jgi:hypothetical protein
VFCVSHSKGEIPQTGSLITVSEQTQGLALTPPMLSNMANSLIRASLWSLFALGNQIAHDFCQLVSIFSHL